MFVLFMAFAIPLKYQDGPLESHPTPEKLVRAVFTAFNEHNPAALADLVTQDFLYMFIQDEKVLIETKGRKAFEEAMTTYFQQVPGVRSQIEGVSSTGNLVAVIERVFWPTPEGERSQRALSVYQIHGDKIRRVWYYPAELSKP